MIASITDPLRVVFLGLLVGLNTLVMTSLLFIAALIKLIVPLPGFRRWMSRILVHLAEIWIANNTATIRWLTPTRITLEGGESLRYRGWYLVISNHQSWVDIPVLQAAFNRRVPFFKFFLKQQLIWVPLLGLAWWALDFPFMRRYDRATLEKHPELRGRDREETRRACERFRDTPVSVMNFVEGTRFTPAKHASQQSNFRHLLKPRSGGVAFVLNSMGDMLQSLIDITILYPGKPPSVVDLLAGRIGHIRVIVRERPLPPDLIGGDYENDADYRLRFQTWLNGLWEEKDTLIERERGARSSASAPGGRSFPETGDDDSIQRPGG